MTLIEMTGLMQFIFSLNAGLNRKRRAIAARLITRLNFSLFRFPGGLYALSDIISAFSFPIISI